MWCYSYRSRHLSWHVFQLHQSEKQRCDLVAILTTQTFQVSDVNPTTVRFDATGTEATPVQSALEDVNGDGDIDMVLQFKINNTAI